MREEQLKALLKGLEVPEDAFELWLKQTPYVFEVFGKCLAMECKGMRTIKSTSQKLVEAGWKK